MGATTFRSVDGALHQQLGPRLPARLPPPGATQGRSRKHEEHEEFVDPARKPKQWRESASAAGATTLGLPAAAWWVIAKYKKKIVVFDLLFQLPHQMIDQLCLSLLFWLTAIAAIRHLLRWFTDRSLIAILLYGQALARRHPIGVPLLALTATATVVHLRCWFNRQC